MPDHHQPVSSTRPRRYQIEGSRHVRSSPHDVATLAKTLAIQPARSDRSHICVCHLARVARPQRAHIQRDSVAAIQSAGGVVLYDWEWNNGGFVSARTPRARKSPVELIGVDYFGHVTSVVFRASSASSAAAASIAQLTQLERLAFFGSPFDDVGMAHVKGLTRLSELSLVGTQITDDGLVHLSELSKLSELNLISTQITDAGLVHLKRLTTLSKLDLSHTQITDAGLVNLKSLTRLSSLGLRGTKVTDAGVSKLRLTFPYLIIDH